MSGKERTDTNEGETIFDLSSEHSQRKVPELNVDLSQKIMQLRAKTPKNQQQAAFLVAKDIVSTQGGSQGQTRPSSFIRLLSQSTRIDDLHRRHSKERRLHKTKKQLEGN